jgi:hypothetical protein
MTLISRWHGLEQFADASPPERTVFLDWFHELSLEQEIMDQLVDLLWCG